MRKAPSNNNNIVTIKAKYVVYIAALLMTALLIPTCNIYYKKKQLKEEIELLKQKVTKTEIET